MTDSEIIQYLILRDNKLTQEFFFVKCKPLFQSIIGFVFSYPVDYDEVVNELYYELMANDAYKLKSFNYRSTLTQWLKVVAIHYFIRMRNNMIGNSSKEPLYDKDSYGSNECESNISASMDIESLLAKIKNKRYVYVIRKLILENVEPAFLAKSMGITTDNLYNIKKRAISALTHTALKDINKYGKK